MGRLGWKPDDFYNATLAELYDAVRGWNEVEKERAQRLFMAARRVAYCSIIAAGGKAKEEDIWPLEIDDKERKRIIDKYGFATVKNIGDQS